MNETNQWRKLKAFVRASHPIIKAVVSTKNLTVVEASLSLSGLEFIGHGVANRSPKDKPDAARAYRIAVGRAEAELASQIGGIWGQVYIREADEWLHPRTEVAPIVEPSPVTTETEDVKRYGSDFGRILRHREVPGILDAWHAMSGE
jgi:hypothetical protein